MVFITEEGTALILMLPKPETLSKIGVSSKNFPDKSGVYFLFDEFDELIYIGQSINIFQRLQAHKNSTPGIKTVSYLVLNSPKEIDVIENVYIHYYKPKFNLNPPWTVVDDKIANERTEKIEQEAYQKALEDGVKRSMI